SVVEVVVVSGVDVVLVVSVVVELVEVVEVGSEVVEEVEEVVGSVTVVSSSPHPATDVAITPALSSTAARRFTSRRSWLPGAARNRGSR
ncbi:MAG: hypothetical protein JJE23_05330, partial [Thermoleophilia bacterium]|nr:hypothetical protein [Thermoleophilia bacterium]